MTRLTADGYMHQVVIQSGSCLDFTLVTLLLFDSFSIVSLSKACPEFILAKLTLQPQLA